MCGEEGREKEVWRTNKRKGRKKGREEGRDRQLLDFMVFLFFLLISLSQSPLKTIPSKIIISPTAKIREKR